jgi:hypothetical protein
VLAVLGTVGGQTQGLVSHELLGAGVDGGSDGDTERVVLVRDKRLSWEGDRVGDHLVKKWKAYIGRRTYPRTTPVNSQYDGSSKIDQWVS